MPSLIPCHRRQDSHTSYYWVTVVETFASSFSVAMAVVERVVPASRRPCLVMMSATTVVVAAAASSILVNDEYMHSWIMLA